MPAPQPAVLLADFQVGQRFTSPEIEVTAEAITGFAGQFDPQPFHTAAETAEGTFFGELVASGWHTAALTMRLLVGSDMQPGWGLIGRAIESLEWPRATRPGDRLHLEIEVVEVKASRSRPEMGIVRARIDTLNQRGEQAQTMICAMVVPTGVERTAAE